MKVTVEAFTTEPTGFFIKSGEGSGSVSEAEIRRIFSEFDGARSERGECYCQLNFLHLERTDDGSWFGATEWLCSTCVPLLADLLSRVFRDPADELLFTDRMPGDETFADSPTGERGDGVFIDVGARVVALENGTEIAVAPFRIRKAAVTIPEFAAFCDETGYVTEAERLTPDSTFRRNGLNQGLRKSDYAVSPATCVTIGDIMRYCEHVGERLPTEAEWLAASVFLDENEWQAKSVEGRNSVVVEPRALDYAPLEFTSTTDGGSIVLRAGPRYALEKGWQQRESVQRFLVEADAYDIMPGFRTVAVVNDCADVSG